MISRTTQRFRKAFAPLPPHIQKQARQAYLRFKDDPYHPSLQFKLIYSSIYSVRIGLHYRALGVWEDDTIIWFWIGSHSEYDNIISQL